MRTRKTFLLIIALLLCTASVRAQDFFTENGALLMVHFGTTYDETRQKTIDAINEKARKAFPGMTVGEAYTSRTVMARLAKKGIRKDTPTDALLKLRAEGVRRVMVQPTYIIDGIEMERLCQEVERLRPFFDTIQVSTPLLHLPDDAERVGTVLASRHPANARKHEHVLFVGHGTEGPGTAIYSQLDYMLHALGHDNYHVATIEGYPTLDTATALLKQQKARKVTLVPLLFVAGDHATNDISVEWRKHLEENGLKVELQIEGLGEVPEIQNLYIEKIRRAK